MFAKLASVAGAIAAAVTGTETADTRAAGVRFGPDAAAARGVVYAWRLRRFDAGPHESGTVTARDIRDAFRTLARNVAQDARFGGRRFPCGPDGPAVFIGRGIRADGDGYAVDAIGPGGVACGVFSVVRADGRPIRRKGAR
jgi:hypothetical protein